MASYFPMIKNTAQRIVFPILDADGDPVTGAAADTPDSEYSLDGGSFADIADEIHEIATASGIYYLDLTNGETNGDVVCIQIKTATAGTKTTVLVFYTSAQSLDTVDTNVDSILADTGTAGVVVASASKTGYALSAAGVDAIWNEAMSGHVTAGTFGLLQCMLGKWEVTANQLKLYDLAGTLKYTFDLTQDDIPTEFNPDKRTPV